jgi:hypothetical protein
VVEVCQCVADGCSERLFSDVVQLPRRQKSCGGGDDDEKLAAAMRTGGGVLQLRMLMGVVDKK